MVEGYNGEHSITLIQNGIAKNTWSDFHLVPSTRPDIVFSIPSIQQITIPGTNKIVDIAARTDNDLTRSVRQGSWEFIIDHDKWNSWSEAYHELSKSINGNRMIICLDDGSVYGYTGRLRISRYNPGENWSSVTIEYILDNGRSLMGRITNKTIENNGIYSANDDDCIGYAKVTVNVPNGGTPPSLSVLTCDSNGTYRASDYNCDGFKRVDVSVPYDSGNLELYHTFTENGYFGPTTGYDGFVNVMIDVPTGSGDGTDLNLINRTVSSVNISNTLEVGPYAFCECIWIDNANIPNCTAIGEAAFSHCARLEECDFPSCQTVGPRAFQRCEYLQNVDLPVCESIGKEAFQGCTDLTSANIPMCSYIDSSVFGACYHLISLYLSGSIVCTLEHSNAFTSTPIAEDTTYTEGQYGSIYVPANLLSDYQTAPNWSYFYSRFAAISDNTEQPSDPGIDPPIEEIGT